MRPFENCFERCSLDLSRVVFTRMVLTADVFACAARLSRPLDPPVRRSIYDPFREEQPLFDNLYRNPPTPSRRRAKRALDADIKVSVAPFEAEFAPNQCVRKCVSCRMGTRKGEVGPLQPIQHGVGSLPSVYVPSVIYCVCRRHDTSLCSRLLVGGLDAPTPVDSEGVYAQESWEYWERCGQREKIKQSMQKLDAG